jgi:tRNA A-37 threonylcarbamoyl transferase component Bud32
MTFVEIDPRLRDALKQRGFCSARDFLAWSGVILSGHPTRHVLHVATGDESYILKKEHHVPLRDRLASAWAGHGWASKSVREACVLVRLRKAGIPCPEVVAAGEDSGQAFLLLREWRGMVDLRDFLSGTLASNRRALADSLGREVARIHAAGFDQPDLYAKHILVRPTSDGFRFCFLDWQRSRARRTVSWRRRQHDLAALDASLAEHLASDRLRLVCLSAYLREAGRRGQAPPLAGVAAAVRQTSERLLKRRRVRELRQPPLPAGTQHLLWLEGGERLCIACDFHAELNGRLPDWLPQAPPPNPEGACVEHRLIPLGCGRTVHLVQRWSRIGGSLREGKFPTPELARAATIFRLQRFGVAGPRLLAMGHHQVGPRQRFSFLVTEPPIGPSLATVLRTGPAELGEDLLRQFDTLMRQIHDAGYVFPPNADPLQGWVVCAGRPILASDEPLTHKRGSRRSIETEVVR